MFLKRVWKTKTFLAGVVALGLGGWAAYQGNYEEAKPYLLAGAAMIAGRDAVAKVQEVAAGRRLPEPGPRPVDPGPAPTPRPRKRAIRLARPHGIHPKPWAGTERDHD